VRETRHLVRGAQKHWLVRKYIRKEKEDRGTALISPLHAMEVDPGELAEEFMIGLRMAREADSREDIAANAYNVAACRVAGARYEEARGYLDESRTEFEAAGKNPVVTFLLEAEVARAEKDMEQALAAARKALRLLDRSTSRDVRLRSHLTLAELHCDSAEPDAAETQLDEAESLAKKTKSPLLRARTSYVAGRLKLLRGDPSAAGAAFDQQTGYLREEGLYLAMARAMQSAAAAYEASGNSQAAAERHYRAARSLLGGGRAGDGAEALVQAENAAKQAKNERLLSQIARLRAEFQAETGAAD
jgi:hypothetical protein